MGNVDSLVFVYNADSGLLNLVKDIGHKLLSPSTYPCSLCDLTYSVLGERRSWVSFRKKLSTPQEYLHIDEFIKRYAYKGDVHFPVIFAKQGNELTIAATKQQLDACVSLKELKSLVHSLLGS